MKPNDPRRLDGWDGRGRGIVVGPGDSPEIRDCTISKLICSGSSPRLTNCAIGDGNLPGEGSGGTGCDSIPGGVYCENSSAPTLVNCTISGVVTCGGGVVCHGSSPTLINCTKSGNSGDDGEGGGVICYGSSPTLTNCIVWGNPGGAISMDESSNLIVSYSCIEGAWPGDGNLDQDPRFVQPEHFEDTDGDGIVDSLLPGDYHLQPGSPCIDTGTCDGAPPVDIEGNPRPSGAGCDMGAYEYVSSPPPRFRRGDTNTDAKIDMSDAISTLGFLFLGKPEHLACDKSGDTNDDGKIDLSDPVALLNHLFLGASAPPEPFAACGVDPTEDGLGCGEGGPCT